MKQLDNQSIKAVLDYCDQFKLLTNYINSLNKNSISDKDVARLRILIKIPEFSDDLKISLEEMPKFLDYIIVHENEINFVNGFSIFNQLNHMLAQEIQLISQQQELKGQLILSQQQLIPPQNQRHN